MKKLHLFLMLLVVVLSTLVACSPAIVPTSTPTASENVGGLGGTSWTLTSYGPASAQVPAAPDVETILEFGDDGTVSGSFGCNGLSGDYSVSGQTITFGPLISTKMACDEPRMTQENEAFKVLNGTVDFVLAGQAGDILIITSADGSSALTFDETAAP